MEEYIRELCRRAGEDERFARAFQEVLYADKEVYREFAYYVKHNNFACEVKVEGYSIVDILIWQIDHFRAWLDRDTTGTKRNGDRMVLLAFDTMLKMRKDPQKYIEKMLGETGTDRRI